MIQGKDFKKIKMLVMDVDGTLTDGKIYFGEQGELFKAFNVRDGYRLIHLSEYGITSVIITGKSSKIVELRAEELGINEIHQGVSDKLRVLGEVKDKYSLGYENIAYIGDDENDLECMSVCSISACPADADQSVLDKVDYVCLATGGNGAVREYIDLIIRG